MVKNDKINMYVVMFESEGFEFGGTNYIHSTQEDLRSKLKELCKKVRDDLYNSTDLSANYDRNLFGCSLKVANANQTKNIIKEAKIYLGNMDYLEPDWNVDGGFDVLRVYRDFKGFVDIRQGK